MTAERLRVDAVSGGYGNVTVLHNVTLSVADGEVLAVLGANGAGKTTLLRTIVGFFRARSGRVYHSGKDITGLRTELRATNGIALAPEGRGIFTTLTVEENLILGARPALLRQRRRRNSLEFVARVWDGAPTPLFPCSATAETSQAERSRVGSSRCSALAVH